MTSRIVWSKYWDVNRTISWPATHQYSPRTPGPVCHLDCKRFWMRSHYSQADCHTSKSQWFHPVRQRMRWETRLVWPPLQCRSRTGQNAQWGTDDHMCVNLNCVSLWLPASPLVANGWFSFLRVFNHNSGICMPYSPWIRWFDSWDLVSSIRTSNSVSYFSLLHVNLVLVFDSALIYLYLVSVRL